MRSRIGEREVHVVHVVEDDAEVDEAELRSQLLALAPGAKQQSRAARRAR